LMARTSLTVGMVFSGLWTVGTERWPDVTLDLKDNELYPAELKPCNIVN